ncbi:cytotoxic translational repressor of toxin-antitoxin stability system [Planomonospora corallina]|uniref:Cytotoxic translational repressor of toxin-antitoxin stability system n=1 Tax=Planomonospora corallina TaxID=1806052 RepID=A0ABV8I046_9ACTN
MTWPQATREEHERFCLTEGWNRVRDARGRSGTHHVTYEMCLPDGRVLRTRISHPPDRTSYGRSLWNHILRDQLVVTEEEFWKCVKEGEKPNRGTPAIPTETLPADLVHLLITKVGLPEAAVAKMTREAAITRLQRFWTEGE